MCLFYTFLPWKLTCIFQQKLVPLPIKFLLLWKKNVVVASYSIKVQMLLKVMAWPIMTVWCCLCRKLNPHALVMGWSSNNTFKEIVFDTSLNSNWLLIGVYVSKDVHSIQLPSTPVLLDPLRAICFFLERNWILFCF